MKVVLAGIGSFGSGWYKTLKLRYAEIQVVVVDRDPRMAERLTDPADRFYTDFVEALDRERPDFVLNVTPPAVHTRLNEQAFDRRLPVLCEKPIAEDYHEAVAVVERAEREGIPFMIAENYRREPLFRKARRWIEAGKIGKISAIYVFFSRETYFEKPYLLAMPEPLLVDVTIHHLDLLRYITGSEGVRVFARSFRPRGSRYAGSAAVDILLEMEGGIPVNYAGSLSGQSAQTGWPGDWRIQGEQGVLLVGESLRFVQDGQVEQAEDFSDVDTGDILSEFLRALREKHPPETSGSAYLKSQKLGYYALESIRKGRPLTIPKD